MNDKDLERELRSQHGPREEGYVPRQLPMSLGAEPAGGSGPSWLLRAAVFVPVAVAGALAVGVVSGILATPGSNGVGGTASASPSASSTPVASTGTGACAPQDVVFTAEPWGAAAGSRGTTVTVTLANGRYACTISVAVSAQIEDAILVRHVLVTNESAPSPTDVRLQPGTAFNVGIAWSNWCGTQPEPSVELSLRFGGWDTWVPVAVPGGGADPVPPCNGTDGSSLSVTELQRQE
jgi:Protein of unknown function (DUF4232)